MNEGGDPTAVRSARDLALLVLILLTLAVLLGWFVAHQLSMALRDDFPVEWYLVDVRANDSLLILAVTRPDPEGRYPPLLCADVELEVRALDVRDVNVAVEIIGIPRSDSPVVGECNDEGALGRVEVALPRPLGARPLVGCRHDHCSHFSTGLALSDETLVRVEATTRD